MDFFTTEVLTLKRLTTYYVLFFIQVLPIISRTAQDGRCESTSVASKEPESELVRGTLGEVGQRRMSDEADPNWRIVAAASVAPLCRMARESNKSISMA